MITLDLNPDTMPLHTKMYFNARMRADRFFWSIADVLEAEPDAPDGCKYVMNVISYAFYFFISKVLPLTMLGALVSMIVAESAYYAWTWYTTGSGVTLTESGVFLAIGGAALIFSSVSLVLWGVFIGYNKIKTYDIHLIKPSPWFTIFTAYVSGKVKKFCVTMEYINRPVVVEEEDEYNVHPEEQKQFELEKIAKSKIPVDADGNQQLAPQKFEKLVKPQWYNWYGSYVVRVLGHNDRYLHTSGMILDGVDSYSGNVEVDNEHDALFDSELEALLASKNFYITYGYAKQDYPFYDKLCEITGLE